MSAISDVLRAVKDVLLLQSQVERMEEQISAQNERVERLTGSVTDIDKRLYAIERMMDLGARQARKPRITDQ